MAEGRMRSRAAARRASRAMARWEEADRSWCKYARCGVCKKTFVANNYSDRKSRVNHLKIRGCIVCPWCRNNPEIEFLVKCMTIVQQMTEKDPPKWVRKHAERKNGSYAGGPR